MTTRVYNIASVVADIALQICVYFSLVTLILHTLYGSAKVYELLLPIALSVIYEYLLRRYLKSLALYGLMQVPVAIGFLLLGSDINEKFFLVIFVILFIFFGFKRKNEMVAFYDETSTVAYKEEKRTKADEMQRIRRKILEKEEVPAFVAILFIVQNVMGFFKGDEASKAVSVCTFLLFVLLQIFVRHAKAMNELFDENAGREDFPGAQIGRVNRYAVFAIMAVSVVLMLLLFGVDSSIFGDMGFGLLRGLLIGVILLIKVLGFLSPNDANDILETFQTTTPITTTTGYEDNVNDLAQPVNTFANSIMIGLTIGVIALTIILIIVGVRHFALQFKAARSEGLDTYDFVKTDREKKRKEKKKDRQEVKEDPDASERKRIRAAFKKGVANAFKTSAVHLSKADTASEILTKVSEQGNEVPAEVLKIYEKARYSEEPLSSEEVAVMQDFVKLSKK